MLNSRDRSLGEKRTFLEFIGIAALQLVEAHVVAAPLKEAEARNTLEFRPEGFNNAREVLGDDLALQCERRGRDDDGGAAFNRAFEGGNEVRERLARARPCLHKEVAAQLDASLDGASHGPLPRAICAADCGDRCRE